MLPDINFFHLTLPVVLLFVGDWMTPTPSHRAHPFHRGERGITVYLYPESILLLLRYLIWSSFQYLVLTYILVTYFSTHACLAWNQLSSSYPTSYIAVAWRLDDAHPFPGPTHSTGGRGDDGLWPWPWPWQGGWGGDPEPGTYIYIYIIYIIREISAGSILIQRSCLTTNLASRQPAPRPGWSSPVARGTYGAWHTRNPGSTHQLRLVYSPTFGCLLMVN